MVPIANVNETIEIKSLVFRGLTNFQFAAASRRAALSGNRSLIVISGPCSGVYHLGHYKNYWTVIELLPHFLLIIVIVIIMVPISGARMVSYSTSSDTVIASVTIFAIFDV